MKPSFTLPDRFFRPTRFDRAPYGSVVRVDLGDDNYEYYVQVADSEEKADWVNVGILLHSMFSEKYGEHNFIQELILHYKSKTPNLLS